MPQSLFFRPLLSLHETRASPPHFSSIPSRPTQTPTRKRVRMKPLGPSLRQLTARIVDLTKRRQLKQIFAEVEEVRKKNIKPNTIVMNAVMEACVHCGDVDTARKVFEKMSGPDSCGVDCVSYGILLKGLGQARRFDEAFQIIESVEDGTATGSPMLSARLFYGLLNAILEKGDMRRANALVARCRKVLNDEGDSVYLYNLLMKGYAKASFPLGALTVKDEMMRQGVRPDKLTYNTLISACVKSGEMEKAVQLLSDMKEEARRSDSNELIPDAVTYTTLLQGFGKRKDADMVMKIVMEMKSTCLHIDRIAYSTMVDALLASGSIKGALCIFGEIIKKSGNDKDLIPKPHLFLSMMRVFASQGDIDSVKKFNSRMWLDSAGSICLSTRSEANELLMEAAINCNQVDVAKKLLSRIVNEQSFSWTSRGGMAAIKVEVLSGFTNSKFRPQVLPEVLLDQPVEKYMVPFEEARPLNANIMLRDVVMRFFNEAAIPVTDEWGNCIGIVQRRDCVKLNVPLSSLITGPPPCVTASTAVARVIDLLLDKKYEMIVVVKGGDLYSSPFRSSSRPLGVFSLDRLYRLASNSESLSSDRDLTRDDA
ncbi:pentatricopeptide repeat-containing protein [Carex littledalei]|uniref:Pentatricopeptide repeat-containing protein n=1 Tax=Carex littledalei TaxID=544730 RepID=A0A833RNY6_9POAL|nr:pentatricopeptide repeat-containing protein [Carex littledalei]